MQSDTDNSQQSFAMKPMKRYSGVLSLFGDHQWFTMNAELSVDEEYGSALVIYKKSPEDSSYTYRMAIDLSKAVGVLAPDTGKDEGLHLLVVVTADRKCHMISALSEVERDNWWRELTKIVGKGHAFPVTLPTLNTFGCQQASMYYNVGKRNLLLVTQTENAMDRCVLLAMWNLVDLKSFGASQSSLVIQTKKSADEAAAHLCFKTPQARRIVNLLQNRCQDGCACCSKPHPFSQMPGNSVKLNGSFCGSCSSGSETDDELPTVQLELRYEGISRHRSVDDISKLKTTPKKLDLPKKSVTIDRIPSKASNSDDEKSGGTKDGTILHSFLFSPHQMHRYSSESSTPRGSRSSDLEDATERNIYEEISSSSNNNKPSLYEEIPNDLKKTDSQPAHDSWGGGDSASTNGRTSGASMRDDVSITSNTELCYEAMFNRQTSSPVVGNDDCYVKMHSLRNSSLSLKSVSSDGQVSTTVHNSTVPLYANTIDRRNKAIPYANLTAVSDARSNSTGNLAYAEISSTGSKAGKSVSRESSPALISSYAAIDHNLTEALRKTTIQRKQVHRSQTIDTAEHKKMPRKKWLTKLAAKKTS